MNSDKIGERIVEDEEELVPLIETKEDDIRELDSVEDEVFIRL